MTNYPKGIETAFFSIFISPYNVTCLPHTVRNIYVCETEREDVCVFGV